MVWPLYVYITINGRSTEFFDGYGRAKMNQAYYNAADDWWTAADKRRDRTRLAVGLFFFRGAESPVSNPQAVPLADPFTGLLLVIGTGYTLAHPLRRLFGLTLVGAVGTLGSALVLTGNFDFIRAGSAVGYVFALAGFGAASAAQVLGGRPDAGGPPARRQRLLAAAPRRRGTRGGCGVCGRRQRSVPVVLRQRPRDPAGAVSRSRLPVLVGESTRSGQGSCHRRRPNFTYLMAIHDASWLRGLRKKGAAFSGICTALSRTGCSIPRRRSS